MDHPDATRVASVDSIASAVSLDGITVVASVDSVTSAASVVSSLASLKDMTSKVSPETVKLFEQRETLHSSELLPTVTSILCGISFGIALNKSRIFEPLFIIEQMLFTRFVMLKCFLSAAATSCFMGVIASHFYPLEFSIARCKFIALHNGVSICLGSFTLGAGMVICGSCPGMVLVQIGAGVPNSGFVLIGVLSGALLFGLSEPIWTKLFLSSNSNKSVLTRHIFLDEALNVSGKIIGIVFGVMFWILVIVFEVLWPWQSELNTPNETSCNFLSCGSWSPAISGCIVGLTQLALISVLGNSLGASSTYVCVVAQWLRFTNNDSFKNFKQQMNRRWQIVFAVSVVFGSWIAVALNNPNRSDLNVIRHPYDGVSGVSQIRAVGGGFVAIIGSLIGKGCPSGHGFSGFMFMTTAAMVAVPSIFIGGIATAFIIEYIGT
eukprot:107132_1